MSILTIDDCYHFLHKTALSIDYNDVCIDIHREYNRIWSIEAMVKWLIKNGEVNAICNQASEK